MRATGLWLGALLIVAGVGNVAVTGEDETFALELHCRQSGADVRSMEYEYLEQGCWGHLGFHAYFVGRDTVYRLHDGSGTAFSVEQQLSPPVEVADAQPWPPQTFTALPIETSMDGIEWAQVAQAEYRFAGLEPGGTSMRQQIEFEFVTEDDPEFRYLRIRQPLSAAQGLSGYIDASAMTLTLSDAGPAPTPGLTKKTQATRTCLQDIMEAVWLPHPCWYGGIDRWDAPSFFHTYPVEGAVLDRVVGTALFAYWRPEDPGFCCSQTPLGMLEGPVFLQSSRNGEQWDTLAVFEATYGVPLEFSVDLDGHEADFLRLVSDHHPGYWQHPALKHPEAYLLHSELSLSGLVPDE